VRKTFEFWNRGDFYAFMDVADEDIVVRAAQGWPERVFYGKDAVRSFYEGLAETMGHDVVIADPIDAGDSVVREYERG
jgi:ketosteroid isomerase-like protein